MVWIESITAMPGRSASSVVRMSRSAVSAPSATGASVSPSRAARIWTCAAASSPETYIALTPWRAKDAAACRSSVDLPMPGSPPTRIADAGTSPPPSTRSSSSIPEAARGGASATVARSVSAMVRPRAPRGLGPAPSGASSTSEFQAPQASQRPAHLLWTAPHAVQVKTGAPLAISLDGPGWGALARAGPVSAPRAPRPRE